MFHFFRVESLSDVVSFFVVHQSATPFKKPRAAAFHPDRFYETLNKAQASIDNDDYGYPYRSNNMPYSSENYDDPKYMNSHAKYQNKFYNRQPGRNEQAGGYGSGHRQGKYYCEPT